MRNKSDNRANRSKLLGYDDERREMIFARSTHLLGINALWILERKKKKKKK